MEPLSMSRRFNRYCDKWNYTKFRPYEGWAQEAVNFWCANADALVAACREAVINKQK